MQVKHTCGYSRGHFGINLFSIPFTGGLTPPLPALKKRHRVVVWGTCSSWDWHLETIPNPLMSSCPLLVFFVDFTFLIENESGTSSSHQLIVIDNCTHLLYHDWGAFLFFELTWRKRHQYSLINNWILKILSL